LARIRTFPQARSIDERLVVVRPFHFHAFHRVDRLAAPVGASNATGVLIAGAGDQTVLPPAADALPRTDLFPIYYGTRQPIVIEISFAPELSSNELSKNELPESILDTGVSEITTVETLRARGYGVTIVEGAAYGKTHTRRAARVYTNADIDRLHSGS